MSFASGIMETFSQLRTGVQGEIQRSKDCLAAASLLHGLATVITVVGIANLFFGLISSSFYYWMARGCIFYVVGCDTYKLSEGYNQTALSLERRITTAFFSRVENCPAWMLDFVQASQNTFLYCGAAQLSLVVHASYKKKT